MSLRKVFNLKILGAQNNSLLEILQMNTLNNSDHSHITGDTAEHHTHMYSKQWSQFMCSWTTTTQITRTTTHKRWAAPPLKFHSSAHVDNRLYTAEDFSAQKMPFRFSGRGQGVKDTL